MVRYGTGASCINLLIFIGKMLNVLILISYHISHIVPIKYQRVFYYSNSDPIGIWAGITPPPPSHPPLVIKRQQDMVAFDKSHGPLSQQVLCTIEIPSCSKGVSTAIYDDVSMREIFLSGT